MLRGLEDEQIKKAIGLMKQIIDEAYANQNAPPFIHLPSKRHYRDYFVTIAEPMALSIVKQKIKKYELLSEMKSDLRLIASNCSQYNEPKSEIVKMSKDLINSIMENWMDIGLQKLMKQQEKAIQRETKAKKKKVSQATKLNQNQEEKQALELLNESTNGFRAVLPKRRYYKLQDYKEYKIYLQSMNGSEEESITAFADLVERVFSFSCSLANDKYKKFLKYLLDCDYATNISKENNTFDIMADQLFIEDLDKINEYIRELKSQK